jgi:predicted permease
MDALLNDVRYATRSLAKSPGFTIVAVATIAIGIGATTVIFSLISALLLRPLPVSDPGELVSLHEERRGAVSISMGYSAFSFQRYEQYREAAAGAVAGMAAHEYGQSSLRIVGPAEVVSSVATSANYFEVLGVNPALGAFFSADANRASEPAVVISHALWSTKLASDPAVVGRTVHLDSRAHTVIGVAPASFKGLVAGLPVDVWYPAAAGTGESGTGASVVLFARMRPEMNLQQTQAALEVVSAQVPQERGSELVSVRVQPLTGLPGSFRTPLTGFMAMLLVTAGIVLAIASTNVGGMLLSRGAGRRREVAVRLAVGASRGRLVRLFLTESILLFALGGAAAVLLTVWLVGVASAVTLPIPIPVDLELRVDWRVLTFCVVVALGTGVAFGLAPALQATRPDLVADLKDGARGQSAHRTRLRSSFVVLQLALSVILLITAALFVRTLQQALAADIGFDPHGVVVGGINLDPHGYDETRGAAFTAELLDRARALPEVEAAAYAVWAPMGGNNSRSTVRPAEAAEGSDTPGITTDLGTVGSGYFEALRIPVVAGRGFTTADRPGAPAAAVINQRLAERLWPGQNPLGRSVRMGGETMEVVGVTGTGKYESYTEDPRGFLYRPLEQSYSGSVTLHVRSRSDAASTLAALRRELAAMDPNVALEQGMPLASLIGFSIFPQRLAAMMIGVFGLAGLLLAAIGLYGILAYQVGARTREIGIRMALGARAESVVGMVMRSSFRLVMIGTAIGLTVAFAATRLLAGLLFGVTPTDPVSFVGVPLLLCSIALLASYLPARRAARVDPAVALRAE